MCALACGLGVWQVQRLAWKRALLARIDSAEHAPGVPLPDHPLAFQKVRVTAAPIPGAVARYGADVRDTRQGPVLGSQVLFAAQPPQGPPLLVDAGWVPDPDPAPPEPAGALVGYVRMADRPGWFSPADDPVRRRFFTLDPRTIGRALGLASVRPYTLVLLGAPVPGASYPQPASALPRPPNDHLQYAITWFSLAATALVIFGVFARRTLLA